MRHLRWILVFGSPRACCRWRGYRHGHALVLARTSKKVTLIHRRDTFRASKVLADRVKNHPLIEIQWNTVLDEIKGKSVAQGDDSEEVDLDDAAATEMTVSGAVFVAIGHSPNTGFMNGIVEFDDDHTGYIKTIG